jgi:hypothetical protein
VLHPLALRWQYHRVARPDERRRRLEEEDRLCRHGIVQLFDVLFVVTPDADDLAREDRSQRL